MAGHRRAEATPFFERLCPAMTKESQHEPSKVGGRQRRNGTMSAHQTDAVSIDRQPDVPAMPIILQSTIGFSAEFIQKLPAIEQTMIAHGLDPSSFVISKDRATPSSVVPFVGPFFYAYTVFIDGESFTLTEPNDMVFLDYFVKLCTAEDDDRALPILRREHRSGPVRRFLSWMSQPV
jgi:hypothetical protein